MADATPTGHAASGYSTLPRSRPRVERLSAHAMLMLSSCLVGPCRRRLGERVGDAEARTCASSSPSPCGTELAPIPSRCPCSCLTAAAWPNVDARHPNCLANCSCPSARPCASPAHRHKTGCLRRRSRPRSWLVGRGHGPRAEAIAARCAFALLDGAEAATQWQQSGARYAPRLEMGGYGGSHGRTNGLRCERVALLFCASPSLSP